MGLTLGFWALPSTFSRKEKKLMSFLVATASLPAVDRPNDDRWNAARLCQNDDLKIKMNPLLAHTPHHIPPCSIFSWNGIIQEPLLVWKAIRYQMDTAKYQALTKKKLKLHQDAVHKSEGFKWKICNQRSKSKNNLGQRSTLAGNVTIRHLQRELLLSTEEQFIKG